MSLANNSYMDATLNVQSKQNFDSQIIANNSYTTTPVMSQTIEHAKIAPQVDAV